MKKCIHESFRSRKTEQKWYSTLFHLRPRRGRKFEITELILELQFIYKTATDRFSYLSPHCTTPTAAPYAGADATWPPTRRASAQNCSRAPGLRGTAPCWRPPELDTRLRKPVTAGRRSPLAAPPRAASPQFAQPRLALPLPLGL